MENCITNRNSIKSNSCIKGAQKRSKKYYKNRLFDKNHHEPTASIQKLVDIENIECHSACKDTSQTCNSKEAFTLEDLLNISKEHQLTGRSGNGFPIATKLENYKASHGILLINGVECDPGLVHDAWIYRNCLDEINLGAGLLNQMFHFDQMVLATKEPLREAEVSFQQIKVKNRFPMGYENYLIKTVLGQDLPAGKHPSDLGILVLNLQTILSIARLSIDSNAWQYKYITVSDLATATAKVMEVRIGQKIDDIVSQCFPNETGKVYVGGGALLCHEAPEDGIIDDSIGYLALGDMPDYTKAGHCVGCGRCNAGCPAKVQVSRIVRYIEKNGQSNQEPCQAFHPNQCIGCGLCTFNCHAGKDIRSMVAWAKQQ